MPHKLTSAQSGDSPAVYRDHLASAYVTGPKEYRLAINQAAQDLYEKLCDDPRMTQAVGSKVFAISEANKLEYGSVPNMATSNKGLWITALETLLHSFVQAGPASTSGSCLIAVPFGPDPFKPGKPFARLKRNVYKSAILSLTHIGWLQLFAASQEADGRSRRPQVRLLHPLTSWLQDKGFVPALQQAA